MLDQLYHSDIVYIKLFNLFGKMAEFYSKPSLMEELRAAQSLQLAVAAPGGVSVHRGT